MPIADPVIGLLISALILRITWDSWQVVRRVTANTAPADCPRRVRAATVAAGATDSNVATLRRLRRPR